MSTGINSTSRKLGRRTYLWSTENIKAAIETIAAHPNNLQEAFRIISLNLGLKSKTISNYWYSSIHSDHPLQQAKRREKLFFIFGTRDFPLNKKNFSYKSPLRRRFSFVSFVWSIINKLRSRNTI